MIGASAEPSRLQIQFEIAGGSWMETGSTVTIPLSLESTIMVRAQETVDHWFRAHGRGPFRPAVSRAAMTYWVDLTPADRLHDAFYQAANAIRLGQGHALRNPGPLLRIVRRALDRGQSVGPSLMSGN